MESLMIYPYNRSFEAIVQHQTLLKNYEIKHLVTPRGWGLQGTKVFTQDSEYIVYNDFTKALNDCSVVCFIDDETIKLSDGTVNFKLAETIEAHKKIIFTRFKHTDYERCIQSIPKELNITPCEKIYYSQNEYEKKIYDISVPIIMVLGTSQNTDKFEIQLALTQQFLNKEYKVATICSRRGCEMLGLFSIPEFMMKESSSLEEKVFRFNHLVKQIELLEEPEVIIIGVPGGAFPLNKQTYNHFGQAAFEISNAVNSDIAVLCSLYGDYDIKYFEEISKGVEQKYGVEVCVHVVSNYTIDMLDDFHAGNPSHFLSLDRDFVRKNIRKYRELNVFQSFKTKDANDIAEVIINKLSENMFMESI